MTTRQRGAPLHPRDVLPTLYAILKAARLPRVRFHDLRPFGASLLISEGVRLAEVSMLLGHSELPVTTESASRDLVLGHETCGRSLRA